MRIERETLRALRASGQAAARAWSDGGLREAVDAIAAAACAPALQSPGTGAISPQAATHLGHAIGEALLETPASSRSALRLAAALLASPNPSQRMIGPHLLTPLARNHPSAQTTSCSWPICAPMPRRRPPWPSRWQPPCRATRARPRRRPVWGVLTTRRSREPGRVARRSRRANPVFRRAAARSARGEIKRLANGSSSGRAALAAVAAIGVGHQPGAVARQPELAGRRMLPAATAKGPRRPPSPDDYAPPPCVTPKASAKARKSSHG